MTASRLPTHSFLASSPVLRAKKVGVVGWSAPASPSTIHEHYYRTLHVQGLWHRKGAALAAIGVHARDPGW